MDVQDALGVPVDGNAGPITWAAIHRAVVGEKKEEPVDDGIPLDARSEKNIAGLLPPVRAKARELVRKANASIAPKTIKILSGFRSYAEQQKLYRAYLNGGPKAAPPGHSGHNFGISFDVGVFRGTKYLSEDKAYKTVGALGRAIGLNWGADFGDEPHFTLRPKWAKKLSESAMMKELRRRKEKGIAVFP